MARPLNRAPRAPRLAMELRPPELVEDVFLDGASHEGLCLDRVSYRQLEADSVELKEFAWTGVGLTGAKLDRLELQDGSLDRCDLANVHSQRCRFVRVAITESRLTGATLIEPSLLDVVFRDSPIDLSSFRFGRLERVRFERCHLTEADFQGVMATHCTFIDCDLTGAQLSQGDFGGCAFRDCRLAGVGGVEALRGAQMSWEDVIGLAGALAGSLGIQVRDDIS